MRKTFIGMNGSYNVRTVLQQYSIKLIKCHNYLQIVPFLTNYNKFSFAQHFERSEYNNINNLLLEDRVPSEKYFKVQLI